MSKSMIIQIVKFRTHLEPEKVREIAESRAQKFRKVPGLLQQYYAQVDGGRRYGGVYIWEDQASMEQYEDSDLAAELQEAYDISEAPEIEFYDVAFQLRE